MEVTIKLDGVGVKELKDLFINILNQTHLPAYWEGCVEGWEFEDRTAKLEQAVLQAIYYAYQED